MQIKKSTPTLIKVVFTVINTCYLLLLLRLMSPSIHSSLWIYPPSTIAVHPLWDIHFDHGECHITNTSMCVGIYSACAILCRWLPSSNAISSPSPWQLMLCNILPSSPLRKSKPFVVVFTLGMQGGVVWPTRKFVGLCTWSNYEHCFTFSTCNGATFSTCLSTFHSRHSHAFFIQKCLWL